MLKFVKLLLFIAVILAVVAYFRGWYSFNTSNDSVNIAIDSKKIDDDVKIITDPSKAGEGASTPAKDERKDDRVGTPGKDDRAKDSRVVTPAKEDRSSMPAKDDRAEGVIVEVAKEMPRFTVRLNDGRYMTFDLAPKAEIRLNDAISDFRMIRLRSKVVVSYYPDADGMNMSPPRNMARTIVIERGK